MDSSLRRVGLRRSPSVQRALVATSNGGSARGGSRSRIAATARSRSDVDGSAGRARSAVDDAGLQETAIVGRGRDVGESAEGAVYELADAVDRTMNRIIEARSQVREHWAAAIRRGQSGRAIGAFAASTAGRSRRSAAIRKIGLDDRTARRRGRSGAGGAGSAGGSNRASGNARTASEQRAETAEEFARGTGAGRARGATRARDIGGSGARRAVLSKSARGGKNSRQSNKASSQTNFHNR